MTRGEPPDFSQLKSKAIAEDAFGGSGRHSMKADFSVAAVRLASILAQLLLFLRRKITKDWNMSKEKTVDHQKSDYWLRAPAS